jgi:DinB superfamily
VPSSSATSNGAHPANEGQLTPLADPPSPTVDDTLARMDQGWAAFHGRVTSIPTERLEGRIGEGGWTRKQMLAHIGTWHDLTIDRLGRFVDSGEPAELAEHDDAINARAARAAEGRTTGEILLAMADSYRRLRREVATLTDAQLAARDGWAAAVIAGNSYGHYADHLPDLEPARR